MRACGRCGHDNADHLRFCCGCGRRLAGPPDLLARVPGPGNFGPGDAPTPTVGSSPAGFADTLALAPLNQPRDSPGSAATAEPPASVAALGWAALRYVFAYVRGRIAAEARKRNLVAKRNGAQQLLEGALFTLGQILVAEEVRAPEVASLIERVAKERARRDAADADLAADEQLQLSNDLRLGIHQSNAENDWAACETRAVEIDRLLRQIEDERRRVVDDIHRLGAISRASDTATKNREPGALDQKRTLLDEQYASLRERAAALRAMTIARRATFDQATAARRQAAAAVTASLAAHARERTEADQQLRLLTIQTGRAAMQAHLPLPALQASYAELTRLEATIADREQQIASVQSLLARTDLRKLAIGAGLMVAIGAVLFAGAWALLR